MQHEARHTFSGEPWACPIHLVLRFTVERPKSHYGSGRNADKLKPSAPAFPASKPDVLKLARGVEDALTSIILKDDAQIVTETLTKRYGRPGVVVEIHEQGLGELEAAYRIAEELEEMLRRLDLIACAQDARRIAKILTGRREKGFRCQVRLPKK